MFHRNRLVSALLFVPLFAAVGVPPIGCANQARSTDRSRELPLEQQHSFEVVQLRAQQLTEGMTRAEVFLLLGSPADYRGDTWVYSDGDQTLTVRFQDDRYVNHQVR